MAYNFNEIRLDKGMYSESGKSFEQVLEGLDPNENYKGTPYEGMDAFQRQLKRFAPEYERLEKAAKLGEKYLNGLRSEVLRLCLVCDKSLHSALSKSVATLDEAALFEMKSAFEARSAELYPPVTQLPGKGEVTKFDGDEYII